MIGKKRKKPEHIIISSEKMKRLKSVELEYVIPFYKTALNHSTIFCMGAIAVLLSLLPYVGNLFTEENAKILFIKAIFSTVGKLISTLILLLFLWIYSGHYIYNNILYDMADEVPLSYKIRQFILYIIIVISCGYAINTFQGLSSLAKTALNQLN